MMIFHVNLIKSRDLNIFTKGTYFISAAVLIAKYDSIHIRPSVVENEF